MKKRTLLLIVLFTTTLTNAQTCLSGDCVNGYGEFKDKNGKIIKANRKDGNIIGFYISELKRNWDFTREIGYGNNKGMHFKEEDAVSTINIQNNGYFNSVSQTSTKDKLKISRTILGRNFTIDFIKDKPVVFYELTNSGKPQYLFKTNGNSYMLIKVDTLTGNNINSIVFNGITKKSNFNPFFI